MKIICNTAAFTETCLNVQRCVPNRSVMPHLECLLMQTQEDSTLKISGFDLFLVPWREIRRGRDAAVRHHHRDGRPRGGARRHGAQRKDLL